MTLVIHASCCKLLAGWHCIVLWFFSGIPCLGSPSSRTASHDAFLSSWPHKALYNTSYMRFNHQSMAGSHEVLIRGTLRRILQHAAEVISDFTSYVSGHAWIPVMLQGAVWCGGCSTCDIPVGGWPNQFVKLGFASWPTKRMLVIKLRKEVCWNRAASSRPSSARLTFTAVPRLSVRNRLFKLSWNCFPASTSGKERNDI